MIVFYLTETGQCMLSIDCDIEDITIIENKAYYNGQIVNNNMEISAIVDVPKQRIRNGIITEDGMEYTPKLFSELMQYTVDEKWEIIRSKRNKLLTATDWTQIDDSPKKTVQSWLDYRQALRDITEQEDPDNITWPIKPEE